MTIREPPCLRDALAQAEALASVRLDEGPIRTLSEPPRIASILPYPLVITLWGVETRSEANQRGHWAARHKRFKLQRATMKAGSARYWDRLQFIGFEIRNHDARIVVTLTRIGPRRLDSDNLAGSMKAVRDEFADWLGVDDGHAGIEWRYDGRVGEPGVIVTVEAA